MKIKTAAWMLTASLLAGATPFTLAQAPAQSSAQTPSQAPVQTPANPARPGTAAVPAAPQAQGPVAPATPAAPVFPPVNLKNFTADSPSTETVNGFLHAIWGFDPDRVWSVAAILKTTAPGVAKVVVFVADKSHPGKTTPVVFFTTPDGKHAIADGMMDFGEKPFADSRKLLQDRADGPARGAAGKEFLFVEFADLQCERCKEAQDTVNHLVQDFPQARFVFEDFPLSESHPYAARAAAEGACVRKAKGDAAFFTYLQAVYDKQAALTPGGAGGVLAAAATAAGVDPAKAGSCADTQAAKDEVSATVKLASDLGVEQEPLLAVNGHLLPLGQLPYETLKRIIAFQGREDGLNVQVQPTLTNLK